MKKFLMVAITLIASVSLNAQSISVTSSAGVALLKHDNYRAGLCPVTMVGLEFNDKFGLEYGYSWGLNDNPNQLYSYLYGTSRSFVVGHFTHLAAFYYKTEREENTNMNIGFGVSSTNLYIAEKDAVIEKNISPYFKVGIDHKFVKNWSVTLNAGIGDLTTVTLGVTKKL